MKHTVLALVLFGALGACAATTGFTPDRVGPELPYGTPAIHDAADGLEIGHRLMAAGEYELALRAYYRAVADVGAHADALSAIGSANLRLGRLGQAEQMLRRALEDDETHVPALNNLGVVLAEQQKWGEARAVFHNAFALDSGRSDEIRENLRLAIANSENSNYAVIEEHEFSLVRRGSGHYLLLATP
jgi:tetratricopeptide (TPR) repeat protein